MSERRNSPMPAEEMREAVARQRAHIATSHRTDRSGWTREQWIADARALMGDLDGSVLDLLNGHVVHLLAEYDERGRELEQLRDRDRLLRHYLGTIANRIGRPTRWDALSEEGEIEHVGEGVLAELERLREGRDRLLAECDRLERHIRENVPHLPPDAGHLTVHVIRGLLGETSP